MKDALGVWRFRCFIGTSLARLGEIGSDLGIGNGGLNKPGVRIIEASSTTYRNHESC